MMRIVLDQFGERRVVQERAIADIDIGEIGEVMKDLNEGGRRQAEDTGDAERRECRGEDRGE